MAFNIFGSGSGLRTENQQRGHFSENIFIYKDGKFYISKSHVCIKKSVKNI